MRLKLLEEMKQKIEENVPFKDMYNSNSIMFKEYNSIYPEDETPIELFNKDGVKVTFELEFASLFISGLTPEEINILLKGVE